MQAKTITENDSILARLKARTAHQHQQTEDGVDLMSDDFSPADYRDLLVKFYAFYQSFEAEMQKAIDEHRVDFDYAERRNSPKLLNDLRSLKMTAAEIEKIPPFNDLPPLDSPEKIFGALYVVEGSTLGGQIIARHLKDKFKIDESNGVAFFSGYGKETGKMWNAFRERITAFAENSDDHEAIIRSANQTFEKFGAALK